MSLTQLRSAGKSLPFLLFERLADKMRSALAGDINEIWPEQHDEALDEYIPGGLAPRDAIKDYVSVPI
jgi:hypothetical protein